MHRSLPLLNRRIVVTRSSEQADALCEKLEVWGAIPIRFPVIQLNPLPAPELDTALSQMEHYDWLIFTSGNAVRFFFERVSSFKLQVAGATVCIAAVGSATEKLLAQKGIPVDFVPQKFTGEQLVIGLGDVAGKQILLPRARIGRPEIVEMLRVRGAIVNDIALYDTVTAVPTPEALAELEKRVDVLTFTSPSSVRNFLKIVRPLRFWKSQRSLVAVIGPSTAEEAEKLGLAVDVMPEVYTIDGLVTAVATYFEKQPL